VPIDRVDGCLQVEDSVLSKLAEKRAVAHVALAGLAVGFAFLGILGFLGSASTTRAATKAHQTNEVGSAWSQLLVLVNAETEQVSDFIRLPDAEHSATLVSTKGSATPQLDKLAAKAVGQERNRVELVIASYQAFTVSVTRIVEAESTGDRAKATRQAEQALLGAASMRKQIAVGVQVSRQQINRDLDSAVQDSTWLRSLELSVAPAVLVLLLCCGLLILAYQRRVERHAADHLEQATHDALTGLANRVKLHTELDRAIGAAAARGNHVGLLLIDLNGFKAVNDTLGHHHGDVLLQRVADRLRDAVPRDCVVARLGGDEFAILIRHLDAAQAADDGRTVAERVRLAIEPEVDLDGETVRVSGSVGLSVYPVTSADATELLQHADTAMYDAKRRGLGVVTYRPQVADRLHVEAA
jgi:diguanylate cyclase (GGDEF)-like protein